MLPSTTPDSSNVNYSIYLIHYTTGFTYLTELGQTVNSADEALDIARAYLEISPLKNRDRAEALTHQSLQTFQDFNRRKLEASAYKLLGEIYLARAHRQESGAIATASQFLSASLHLYRELDLTEKAAEVEQLMSIALKPYSLPAIRLGKVRKEP